MPARADHRTCPDRSGETQPPAVRSSEAVDAQGTSTRPGAGCWHSDELFGAAAEVQIVHGAQVYRLRKTALGKLILTK